MSSANQTKRKASCPFRHAALLLFAVFVVLWPREVFDPSPPTPSLSHGMVASAHVLASEAGFEILKKGGNAVDAAVATAFAIGVVEPYASGLGGGGFMLIFMKEKKKLIVIDHRDVAPSGGVSGKIATEGPRSVAIPGTPAGLALALQRFGTMKLSLVIEPAARLAQAGFRVDPTLAGMMRRYAPKLSASPAARTTFLKNGRAYKAGEIFRQKELAKTLRLIGEEGAEVFYKGQIAEALAQEMKKADNWMTRKDIEAYRALEREPVTGRYRGYLIASVPPPGSGLLIIEFLNIVEAWKLDEAGHNSPETLHIMLEALRRVFVDRARFLGDPSFVKVPVASLTSKGYAMKLREEIETARASRQIKRIEPEGYQSDHTTHISVVDGQGNAVSHTQTIGNFFGSGVAIPGTGVLLNNGMADFSPEPDIPNALVPGKRSASSMSPTIVLKDEKPYLVVGGAGAMRIVSSLSQIIINMIDYGMDINTAISVPRVHAQSRTATMESRIPQKTRRKLREMGYRIDVRRDYDLFLGGAQGISIDPNTEKLQGAADPRRKGAVVGN